MKHPFTIIVLSAAAIPLAANPLPAENIEFFESKIRPVLAENCYDCHNSVNKTKAGLALDYRDALLAGSENGSIIEPGAPEDSVLMWAIRHEEDLEMPSDAPKLSESVIADFETWIAMGAPDPRDKKPTQLDLDNAVAWETLLEKRRQWWSFQPLVPKQAPRVGDPAWNSGTIDRFIYSELEAQGLEPSDPAAPQTLVRRVHLILTGLPPKPEVSNAFVENPSERAYRKMVDELLSSEAYGEKWARHWMDWYRYAESHGSEGDPNIPYASVYRDYLIRALNQDVPYDQLLREHLAGDLLRNPRINEELGINESAIGPAHLRMVPHGFGVTDAYQEQIATIDNQIDVLSKAMLGITVSCARCHNHKFDPISQADFYRFFGIMASVRPGTINVDTPEKQTLHNEALEKLKRTLRKPLADYWLENVDTAIERLSSFQFEQTEEETLLIKEWGKPQRKRTRPIPTDPETLTALRLKREMDRIGPYHSFAPLKDWDALSPDELSREWMEQIERHEQDRASVALAKRNASFYADLRDPDTLGDWFLDGNGLTPKPSPAGVFAIATQGDRAIAGVYPAGVYSHLLSDKHIGTLASPNHIAEGDWAFVRAMGQDGAVRMSARNYPLEQGLHPYETADSITPLWLPMRKYQFWNEEQVHFQVSTLGEKPVNAKERRSWFGALEVIGGDAKIKELGNPLHSVLKTELPISDRDELIDAYQQALEESIRAWRRSRISDAQAMYLNQFVQHGFLPNRIEALPNKLASLVGKYRRLESEIPIPTRAPGVIEAEVVDQPLLVRGDYKNPASPLPRQFLEVFSDQAYSDRHSGRLELAEDIVSQTNPLKSRVIVNRLWNYVFGQGIVPTTDNFGRLGKKPTHPLLLDQLAIDFEQNGWSIKTALREIVLSRTFRSSSQASDTANEKDPNNVYLSCFTPRRLDAEAIMDSINSLASDDFERAVYANAKRNQLHPFLKTFNLPIPTSAVSKRDRTNVPAQALTLMNGPFVQDAAKRWADKVESRTESLSPEAKIEALFLDAYSRMPSPREQESLAAYYRGIEDSDSALERTAFALLNSKEFIYVY